VSTTVVSHPAGRVQRGRLELRSWAAYGFAALAVGLGVAARLALELLVPGVVPFATLFPAVLAAAVVGGTGPGVLALLLSTLAGAYLLLPLRMGYGRLELSDALSLALYVLASGLILLLAHRWREARDRAELAQAAQRAAEGRLGRVLATAPVGIVEVDGAGSVTYANPAAGRMPRVELPTARVLAGEAVVDAEVAVADAATGRQLVLSVNAVPVIDARGAVVGATAALLDITQRKAAEARQALLLAELEHRVKNLLAVVQAIAAQSLSGDRTLDEARGALMKRLRAVGKAHDLVLASGWQGASLRAVLEGELRPYGKRARLSGPDLTLAPKAAQTFALVLHELATNAAKHGALGSPKGWIEASWAIVDPATPTATLCLVWREHDGPPVQAPLRRGFGRILLEQGLRHDLGGEVALAFLPDGLVCTIDAMANSVLAAESR
jgi:two-component sensor histidine kinase